MATRKQHTETMTKKYALWLRTASVLVVLVCLIHLLQLMVSELARNFITKTIPLEMRYQSDPAKRRAYYRLNGDTHLLHHQGEIDPNTGRHFLEIYDANNILLERVLDDENHEYQRFQDYMSFCYLSSMFSDRGVLKSRYSLDMGLTRTFDLPVLQGGRLIEIWRYDRNRQIFRGHDRSGAVLGCLGAEGFTLTSAENKELGRVGNIDPIWSEKQQRLVLWWTTDHRVYRIDVKTRGVEVILDFGDREIVGAGIQGHHNVTGEMGKDGLDPNVYRPLYVCNTADGEYHLVLENPGEHIVIKYPKSWGHQAENDCFFSSTYEGLYLRRHWVDYPSELQGDYDFGWYTYQQYLATPKTHWQQLYRIDQRGQLEEVHSFAWEDTPGWYQTHSVDSKMVSLYPWVASTSPGLYALTGRIVGTQTLGNYYFNIDRGTWRAFVSLIREHAKIPKRYLLVSLIWMVLAFLHGRPRWNTKIQAIGWLILVLLFNIAGFLTYLALNHTPLIHCESCGKKRGLKQDACPRCHASLPEPEQTRPHLVMA